MSPEGFRVSNESVHVFLSRIMNLLLILANCVPAKISSQFFLVVSLSHFPALTNNQGPTNPKLPIAQHNDLGFSGASATNLPGRVSMDLLMFRSFGPTATPFLNLAI